MSKLAQRLTAKDLDLVDRVQDRLIDFSAKRIWRSIADDAEVARLRESLGADLEEFSLLIARSEQAVYDKRARTLRESHPLALQVNLETGVANGVLVVRNIRDCAALLRSVLLLRDDAWSLEEKWAVWWYLGKERISGCIFRVVTNDRKLNNCFWNFLFAVNWRENICLLTHDLIMKRTGCADRWEYRERGDYNLERFDREIREQIYSDRGKEIPRSAQEAGEEGRRKTLTAR